MATEKTPRERAEDLISLLVSDWRPAPRQVLWGIRITIILSILLAIGYAYGVTLWDWIELLIVPAAIAFAGLWFNAQQRDREQKLANDHAQDEALQAYLDQMSQLLADTERPLRRARPGDTLSMLARARTLTTLARLDGVRKRNVVQFLRETELINKHAPVMLLDGADLDGASLSKANLLEVNLSQVNLKKAELSIVQLTDSDLRGAQLQGANLRVARLGGADLSTLYRRQETARGGTEGASIRTDLSNADLTSAILLGTDLSGANLTDADLSGAVLFYANLTDAKGVTEEQLEQQAERLQGVTLPSGQKYEKWLKDKEDRGEHLTERQKAALEKDDEFLRSLKEGEFDSPW